MDEPDDNKLKPADDEREVESEEKQRGEEIEVDEDRLPLGRWRSMNIFARKGKKRWSAMRWPCCGRRLQPVCRWAPPCWRKGFSRQAGGDPWRIFTREPRVYLRLYYRDYGPPAAVHGKHGHRRTAGDAQSHPRKRRFADAAMVGGTGGQSHRHRGGRMGLQLYACF